MSSFRDIPSGPHFAIITETSVHIPGDERSRTNPGHGYPEHTETYINYEAFTDRADWETRIAQMSQSLYSTAFRAISVTPATVETKVSVSVS